MHARVCTLALTPALGLGLAGGARELAAARMQLRTVLKPTEERFGESASWRSMAALLVEVEGLEQGAQQGQQGQQGH